MKHAFIAAVAATALSLGLGLVATNAGAAYSGFPSRTVCPAGAAAVPHWSSTWGPNNNAWTSVGGGNICGIKPMPGTGGFVGTFLSIPYDTNTAAVSGVQAPTVGVTVHGDGSTNQVCVRLQSYDSSGNWISTGTLTCSGGTSINRQTLYSNLWSVGVPAEGTVNVYLYGSNDQFTVDMISWQQYVNAP